MSSYQKIAKNSLCWILRNQKKFKLPASDFDKTLIMLKPLGELVLTSDILCSYFSPRIKEYKIGMELLNFCWRELGNGEILCTVLTERPDLVILGALYPSFRKFGFHNSVFEKLLFNTIKIRGVKALEFPPWRRLELATTFDFLKINSTWKINPNFHDTWLYHMPEPWSISEGSAYSLTHTVFYMTRFGNVPKKLPLKYRRYLKFWAPSWLHYYNKIGNFDLFAEFIMVLRCIGEPDEEDWGKYLVRRQKPDGMIPGPPTYGGLDTNVKDPKEKLFMKNYHTTLVSLMASAMSIVKNKT